MFKGIDLARIGNRAYWEERAEETRAVADGFRTPTAKRAMLRLADAYAKLAQDAERIAKNRPKVT